MHQTITTKSGKEYKFTPVNRDQNGNNRFVVHFLNLGLEKYESNDITRKIGLSKYKARSYGGGFVCTPINLRDFTERLEAVGLCHTDKEKVLKEIFDNDPDNILDISNDKNNVLIAEFMELAKQHKDKEKMYPLYEHPITGVYEDGGEICYHSDWRLLIPVVQLCKERQIFGSQNLIDNIDNVFTCDLEIDNLYGAVIMFIKFYNENKK